MVIHGEGRNLGRQLAIIDEISRGTDIYTVELVNATGDDLAPQTPMSAKYMMIVTVMMQTVLSKGLDWEEMPKKLLSRFRFSLRDPYIVWGISPRMMT